jgi:hypothetical protein
MQTIPEFNARPAPATKRAGPGEPEPAVDESARRYVVPEVEEVPPVPVVDAPEDVEW